MAPNTQEVPCLFCEETAIDQGPPPNGVDSQRYDCKNCGRYEITRQAASTILREVQEDPIWRAVVSHEIAKQQSPAQQVHLDRQQLKKLKGSELPKPGEQLESILRWIGGEAGLMGGRTRNFDIHSLYARFGALNFTVFAELVGHLKGTRKLICDDQFGEYTLTIEGWENYHELLKGHTDSMTGFIAMEFEGSAEHAYENCFKLAAERAGFRLEPVSKNPKPGFIDNEIRVRMLVSRFAVVDLSDSNNGAYFEAGFAEGNGKTVIYTCKESEFKNVHFDTSHQFIIKWEEEYFKKAEDDLASMLRRKFPDIATMED